MLGAIAIAPVAAALSAGQAEAAPSDSLFYQRLAAFDRANAEFLRCCAPGVPDEIGDEACGIAGDAYGLMIETPAPDYLALVRKIDALGRWSKECALPPDEVAMIAEDAARLLATGGVA
ncbi:hypothetical protein PX554_26180 [Sphingomonas sp. H39-1-10]|uniref:hypothetical protein n=1 Tax=Sphingomonas pollutisoli TaxID=3030829 RepID=UPI0023B97A99|nr:hypothetical protein [Sphingomonas pollutisoli]MDF0491607.1 hypothetical protein [Sphingomonas pollutisoli]